MNKLTGILLMGILALCTGCGIARQNSQSPEERYARRTGTAVIPKQASQADKITARSKKEKPGKKDKAKADKPQPAKPTQPTNQPSRTESLKGHEMVVYAKEFLGTPYKYAGNGPKNFDCSGFTRYVYQHFGLSLPRNSADQYSVGRLIRDIQDIQPGDLVFFARNGQIFHVGIAVENLGDSFTFIHASNAGVIISKSTETYWKPKYYGTKRML